MANKKGPIDKLFDIADGVLDTMGADPASQKQPPVRVTDGKVIDVPGTDLVRHQDWEQTWKQEVWWAVVVASPTDLNGAWHAFREGETRGIGCGTSFRSDLIRDRQKLQPGKVVAACTSCIVAVCRHG